MCLIIQEGNNLHVCQMKIILDDSPIKPTWNRLIESTIAGFETKILVRELLFVFNNIFSHVTQKFQRKICRCESVNYSVYLPLLSSAYFTRKLREFLDFWSARSMSILFQFSTFFDVDNSTFQSVFFTILQISAFSLWYFSWFYFPFKPFDVFIDFLLFLNLLFCINAVNPKHN